MPYITRCITSVADQSIGRDAVEIVAVDDGSTDGTSEELDRLSREYPTLLQVFHQSNSGGPSAPRNKGLDHARGTFVFFLDADDHLAPEALERMVAMAETNGTDIVLGKMVGVGGRGAPTSMFRRNQPRTDVFASRVYWTLNPMKLFRRELLERLELRFPTDLKIGEDQLFVGPAYLHANGISVVADYDCLYWVNLYWVKVKREDSGNITLRTGGSEPRLRFLPRMVDLLLEQVPPGPDRDHLAHRHLTVEVQQLLTHLVHEPRPEQEKALARLAEVIAPLWHEGLNDRLSAMARLRLHLVRHTMLDELLELVRFESELGRKDVATPVLVDGGRAYARYPYLRDPSRGIPDTCYDVTRQLAVRHRVTRAELRGSSLHLAGHGYLHRIATEDVTTELLLRERGSGTEYRVPVAHTPTPGLGKEDDEGHYVYETAGFEVSVDVDTAADGSGLPDGLWDISLVIGAQGISRAVRIGSKRDVAVPAAAATHIVDSGGQARAVTLYTTTPHGNFTLDIGERKHGVLPQVSVSTVRWAADAPTELEFGVRCTLAGLPDGALALHLEDGQGGTAAFPAHASPSGADFVVRVPVAELPAGLWAGRLRLGGWAWGLPPVPKDLVPAKWRRRGLPWYAKPVADHGEAFVLQVARTDVVRAVARRLKP